MAQRLNDYLTETGDPRVVGSDMKWIDAMYYAKRDFSPIPSDRNRKLLGLEEQYFYAVPGQND